MKTIVIHPRDNVAVALEDITAGEMISAAADDSGKTELIAASEDIPRGHKIALTDIKTGEDIVKYGCRIGTASDAIRAGEHVHVHNVKTALSEDGEYVYEPVVYPLPKLEPRTFMGYRRPKGKIGIRNELWIIPTVGCVNSIAEKLARDNQDLVKGSIDGLYAFTHPYGCSQMGDDHATTRKMLASLVRHPNAGGVLVLSLGCENLTEEQFKAELCEWNGDRVKFLTCQKSDDELADGRKLLEEIAAFASGALREEVDASELIVGMKCGGSDGLSGITANPVVGRFSDRLISLGGSTVLTEVPEMFGAESILFNRCRDTETFNAAVSMVENFKQYFVRHGQVVYENPSPGNKAGGITTLEDKSCGCVQKGGSAPVVDVLEYADPVKHKGLSLLSGPGNDMVSATDLTAAGAHMILFTTGRGTPFGAPAPTVKISTNTALYEKKGSWIDFNAGTVAEGSETPDEAGDRLLDYVLEVASGRRTQQEEAGYREISIFKDGVTL
ncbi:MAG: altronate dehydratase family protein [Lachnospiraceae bacterium]|nr:altronate dehydratase family protein [Lachnospiraceae bacterium]